MRRLSLWTIIALLATSMLTGCPEDNPGPSVTPGNNNTTQTDMGADLGQTTQDMGEADMGQTTQDMGEADMGDAVLVEDKADAVVGGKLALHCSCPLVSPEFPNAILPFIGESRVSGAGAQGAGLRGGRSST